MPTLTPTTAAHLANTALAGITREFPNQIAHPMASAADLGTPRQLHPAFFGCYDWHSAVHTHWCLVRLLRAQAGALHSGAGAFNDPTGAGHSRPQADLTGAGHSRPQATWADQATAILNQHLTPKNIAAEAAYLAAPGRSPYERPYGLAWLLQLDADLHQWAPTNPKAARWQAALQPLAALCAQRLITWFTNLTHPVRTGVHSQSAFAMSLTLDWARATNNHPAAKVVGDRARALHIGDQGWSFTFEPSGEDFLSPGLAAADLMRRVLTQAEFTAWLDRCLPELASPDCPLAPVQPKDSTDGRLAHLDGLCLSRAWMLEGICLALPSGDPRRGLLPELSSIHLTAGLAAAARDDYARAHWLASFATYALTQ